VIGLGSRRRREKKILGLVQTATQNERVCAVFLHRAWSIAGPRAEVGLLCVLYRSQVGCARRFRPCSGAGWRSNSVTQARERGPLSPERPAGHLASRAATEFHHALHPERTAPLNDSFGVSRKNVSASRRSKCLRRRGGSLVSECSGTTTSGHIKRSGTKAIQTARTSNAGGLISGEHYTSLLGNSLSQRLFGKDIPTKK
jgi:hypothetical protein